MKRFTRLTFLMILLLTLGTIAGGQTTAFSYQGSLVHGGVPANGNFDFQFVLYSVPSGGSPIGLGLALNDIAVTNGSFSVTLNFQNQFPGADRFLEIRVRPAGAGSHTTLTPRQQLTSTPYAVRSLISTNADQLGGIAPSQFVLTGDPRLTDSRTPLANSPNYIQNRSTQQASSNFNVSGHGTVGGSLSAGENSFFEKAVNVGTTLNIGASATVGTSLTVGSNVNAAAVITTGGVSVGTVLNAAALNATGSATVGGNLNVAGPINTGTQLNVGGHFALGRSRLDLFNTNPVPDGYSFQVLNSPNFLVLRNGAGSTLMTITQDGKVGMGDNNPTEATLEIGGTISVSNLGGTDGEHLCRDGNLIRACSVARPGVSGEPRSSTEKIAVLESTVRLQHIEIGRQRNELAALKSFICAQTPTAEMCRPNQ